MTGNAAKTNGDKTIKTNDNQMKDFLLLSSINAITYKEFFPLLKEGKARGGYNFNKVVMFETPEGEAKKQSGITWFTSLPTPDKKKLILTKKYKHTEYPHYDNYNAIEVGKIKDIPCDYDCVMGVPITIFHYDLDNIEIEGCFNQYKEPDPDNGLISGAPTKIKGTNTLFRGPAVNEEAKYFRVIIKKKIVIMGEKTINGKDTHINGKEKYRRVCVRFTGK